MLALAIVAFFGVFIVGVLVFTGRQTMALPDNTPARFVAEHRREPGEQVVVCLGASITHGRLSASWVELLAQRLRPRGFRLVNAGINGDLAYNARRRLPDVIACQPDAVVVLVGTNDVLAGYSPRGEARYRSKALPTRPTIAWYRENLQGIVSELKQRTRARIALCALPMLGEDLSAPINQRLREYNTVVREVTEQEQVTFVPVYDVLAQELAAHRPSGGHGFNPDGLWPLIKAMLLRFVLGWSWGRIAASNGYLLLTDGIHLDDRAAARLADLVEGFLLKSSPTSP